MVFILAMAILTFSKTQSMFILVAVIWGIGHAFIFPSLIAYALEGAGPSRGLAMGTFTAISDFGIAAGPVIMGIINLSYFNFFVRIKRGPFNDTHFYQKSC